MYDVGEIPSAQELHYLAYIQWSTKGRSGGWRVHTPLDESEEQMISDGFIEVDDVVSLGMYNWAVLKVTEYGEYILEEAGPKLIALACLDVGDPVLAHQYVDQLTLADLPEFLASKRFMVRETAKRMYDRLTGYTYVGT